MRYVIFHKETTCFLRIMRNRYWQNADFYTSEAAAKSGLTRAAKKGKIKIEDYGILPIDQFLLIEKTEIKYNLLTGKEFQQSVNTPASCDPSTELYHTM